MTVKCDICGKEFESNRSMKLHRRWHDLPESLKKISESLKEYHKNKTKVKAPNETNKTHEKIEVYNN